MIEKFLNYNIWMIHEITQYQVNILKSLSKDKNIFIWDDGVLSQYIAIKELLEYNNILAISTNIVNTASSQINLHKIMYETTKESHKRYHEKNNACAFMTWNDIIELNNLGVYIAAHGYNHIHLNTSNILKGSKELQLECELIKKDFIKNLKFYPKLYVYPYNEKTFWSESILHLNGMKTIGPERLNIKDYFSLFIRRKK